MISSNRNTTPFILSAVYNYAQPHRQHQVWNELKYLPSQFIGNWVVLGDFNCILDEWEKKGGIKPKLSKF